MELIKFEMNAMDAKVVYLQLREYLHRKYVIEKIKQILKVKNVINIIRMNVMVEHLNLQQYQP
jgi:hypothetical protein